MIHTISKVYLSLLLYAQLFPKKTNAPDKNCARNKEIITLKYLLKKVCRHEYSNEIIFYNVVW